MSLQDQPLTVIVNGQPISFGLAFQDKLIRSVIISLFTWRQADPGDQLPGNERMGWWGDDYAPVKGDKIGSRLWELYRAKLVPATYMHAKAYAEEALKWMVEDSVAARIDVVSERYGLDGLALACSIYQSDGSVLNLKFQNVWEMLKHV